MRGEVDARRLADGVVRTARWSGHLSPVDQRTVLRLWLACKLAGQPRESVRRALQELMGLFEPARELAVSAEPAVVPQWTLHVPAPLEKLIGFAKRYYGSEWESSASPQADADRALEALEELEAKVWGAVKLKPRGNVSLSAALDSLADRAAGTDAALQKAAQESFERILESLNPTAVETQVGSKGLRMGPFHKASLYEAWCEKFEQLRAYHDSGRLVGDFRSAFKRYVRALEEEERKR